jgi:hypothetical protein
MRKLILPRRTLLKGLIGGVVASIALPTLNAMLNGHGTALADGKPIPKRFGLWFWGNGVRRAHWIPAGTGEGWTAGEELAPLNVVKEYVSPITGLEVKTATHPHHSGMTGILTGKKYFQVGTTRDTIVSSCDGPSIDQTVAEAWKGTAPYRSLELGVCRFRGTDEGTTFQHLSHNGRNNVNPSEYVPAKVFERLFGAGPTTPQLSAARKSVLDAVMEDAKALQSRVGAVDRVRLEQHLESIRAIETRLATTPALCTTPARPGEFGDVDGKEPIAEINRAQSELLAMALACDLTRVFSVLFSTCGAGTVFWPVGASNSMHQICHDEANPQPTVHRATVFTMQQLAACLDILKKTPEGTGNLLDSCAILCTTELSEGNVHSNDEFPILLVGRAGGKLKSGYHYRSPSKENASRALLTALRSVDVALPSFGEAGGYVTDHLGPLLL